MNEDDAIDQQRAWVSNTEKHEEVKRMKKLVILIPFLLAMGCAQTNVVVKEFPSDHIIHFNAFQKLDNPSILDTYAVYLEKGDTFPLELSLNSDILGFFEKKVNMVVKERIYFRLKMPLNITKEKLSELKNLSKETLSNMSESDREQFFKDFMVYVSKDGIHWAACNDLDGIKGLFGIKGGSISLGMGMNEKDGVWSFLNIKMSKL
jgi:hypothetical protein